MTRDPDASQHGPVAEGTSLNGTSLVPTVSAEDAARISVPYPVLEEVRRVPSRPGRTTIRGLPASAADALVSQLTSRELFALRRARRLAHAAKAKVEHTPEEDRRDAMRLLARALWGSSPPPLFQFTWDLFGVDELAEALGHEAKWDHAARTVTVNDRTYTVRTGREGVDVVLVTETQPSRITPPVSPPEATTDGDRVP